MAQALPPRWTEEALPRAWPDRPSSLFRLIRWLLTAPLRRYEKAELPAELALHRPVPDYAREAFHGMPNGYYSIDVVDGYDLGFELAMLGQVQAVRKRMTQLLQGAERVLDVGCGTGRLANTLLDAGIPEVWGIDLSPYVLGHARKRSPQAFFTQGPIEDTDFPDGYFGAAGACFLFHELPREVAARALGELHRILRPGGVLCITEPCPDHLNPSSRFRLWREHGLKALYFHVLAHLVYEPFLEDWRALGDYSAWFEAGGFELVQYQVEIPFSTLVARRR